MKLRGLPVAFADDMALTYIGDSVHEINDNMNHDFTLLRQWFTAHCMVLSNKTKIMYFSLTDNLYIRTPIIYHSLKCDTLTCQFNNQALPYNQVCSPIEIVKKFKYLGINLDSQLNWKNHIAALNKSFKSTLRNLYNLRIILPRSLLKSTYFAFMHSRLEYCLSCWGGAYYTSLRPLVIGQKHAIRIISFRTKRDHSFPLFKQLNVMPLRQLYVYKVLKIFFKRSGQRCVRVNENYNLRYKNICVTPLAKKQHFNRSFLCMAPRLYNFLPQELHNTGSFTGFLKQLRNWLFQYVTMEWIFDVCE